MTDVTSHHETPARLEHETTDVSAPGILLFIGALGALIVLISGGLWLMFNKLSAEQALLKRSRFPLAVADRGRQLEDRLPPQPRLEGLDPDSLIHSGVAGWPSQGPAQRERNEVALSKYGWVDAKAGVAQIPIDRAIELLAGKLACSERCGGHRARSREGQAVRFKRLGGVCGSGEFPRLRVGLTNRWVCCMMVVIACVGSAAAQGPAVYGPANVKLGQVVDQSKLPEGLDGVGIEQRLDQAVPPDLTFVDDTGKQVRLGDYFGSRPVILVLAYFRCPMLCTQVLNGVSDRLRYVRLEPGKDFEIVCVSFDPSDTPAMAAAKKASYIEHYNRPEAAGAWHFLTGDQKSIDQLTQAVGFNYRFDPNKSQFAHGSTVMLVTPSGRLSRYFMGLAYSARDLQLGLIEASHGQIGSPVQQMMLYCFSFDGASGKYTLSILNLVRAGGAITVFLLCCTFFVAWRRTRQHPAGAPSTAT